jgi:NADPH-dependent 2,4-dienoyl-CoA reductase/sulfur reductase-like enzyme
MPYNLAVPERDIQDLVVRPAQVFREKQDINVLTGHCVDTIDRENQTVSGATLDSEQFIFPYDRLLIATGSAPIVPTLAGFDLPEVAPLKTLEDARKIKNLLKTSAVKKVVIIGMGYIALEMCEALGSQNITVAMVKPNPVFLPWLEPSMAAAVKKEIESKGIKVYTGHTVAKIEQRNNGLEVVCENLILDADMVLLGIGTKPNSRVAEKAGLALGVNKSIAVDRRLQTQDPNIYAAGDCADAYHIVTGKKTWMPLALRANRAGWAVADNVCGRDAELDGVAGSSVFKVFDFEVARTGLNVAEAREYGFEPVENVIKSRSKAHAHPGSTTIWVNMIGDKKSGRLLGAQMVGKEGVAHRINVPAVALHNQMTVAQYSQTDLAYAPPFGPTWDPTLTAANQLLKKL